MSDVMIASRRAEQLAASTPSASRRGAPQLLRAFSWGLLFALCSTLCATADAQALVLPRPAQPAYVGQTNITNMIGLIRESCKTVKFTAADVPATCKSRDAAIVCGEGGCLDSLLTRFISNALPKNVSCTSLRSVWDEASKALSGDLPPECSTSSVAGPLISAGSNLPAILTCDRRGLANRIKVPCRLENGGLSFVGGTSPKA